MVFIDFAFCFLIKMNVSMFQNAKVQVTTQHPLWA